MVALSQVRRLTVVGSSLGMDKIAADLARVSSGQREVTQTAEGMAVSSETSARRLGSVSTQWSRLTAEISGNVRAGREYERTMRLISQADQQGIASALELAKARASARQSLQSAPIRGPHVDHSGINSILGIRDGASGTARASADAFARELDRMDDIARQKAALIGETFRDNLNRSFGIGASAAAGGATFSALEEQLRRLDELDRARAVQAAATSQQDLADRFGFGRGAGSARASAAVFEEAAREVDRLDAAAKELLTTLNPLSAAQDRLNASVARYAELRASGRISAEQEADALRLATKEYNETAKELGSSSRFGLRRDQVTNLGYQASDIVAQLGSGAGIGQIAAQQGPQIIQILAEADDGLKGVAASLVGLINPTTLVIAGLAAVNAGLLLFGNRGEANMKKAEKAADAYSAALGRLRTAQGSLSDAAGRVFDRASTLNASTLQRELQLAAQQQAEGRKALVDNMMGATVPEVGLFSGGASLFGDFGRTLSGDVGRGDFGRLVAEVEAGRRSLTSFRDELTKIRLGTDLDDDLKKVVDTLLTTSQGAQEAEARFKALTQAVREQRRELASQAYRQASDDFQQFVPPQFTQRELVEQAFRRRMGAVADVQESPRVVEGLQAAAEADRARALEEVGRQEGVIRAGRELDLRAIGARTVAERALIEAERERLALSGENIDASEKAARIGAAAARVQAEAVRSAEDHLRTSQSAYDRAGLTGYAAQLAEINARFRDQIAVADGSAEAIKRLQKARALDVATLQIQTRRDLLQPQQDQLRQLQAEAELIGANDNARHQALVSLQAENDLRRAGIELGSDLGRAYTSNARALSDFEEAIRRQNEAWNDMKRSGESAIDSLVEGLASGTGDIGEMLGGIAQDLTRTFLQIGVANPLKNALLGTSYGTLSDVFGAKPKAPDITMPGMQSVAAMNVQAGVVNVGGAGLAGLLGGTGAMPGGAAAAVNSMAQGGRVAANGNHTFPQNDVVSYIRQAAAMRGIDPETALRVIRQESSFNINARNISSREESYGLMQLNAMGGLGEVALDRGINIRDPSTWRQQVDFGLDTVRKDGWRQWYGARDVGISRWEGINRGAMVDPKMIETSAAQITQSSQALAQNASAFQNNFASTLNDGLVGGMASVVDQAVPGLGGVFQMLIQGLQQMGGGGGAGGLLGSLFGGGGVFSSPQSMMAAASAPGLFSNGGYTGVGGVHQPAGIVHRGEVVWSQRDIARAGGVAAVEGMRLGLPGYASGGIVGEGRYRPPANYNAAPPAQSAPPSVVFNPTFVNAPPVRETYEEDDGRGGRRQVVVFEEMVSKASGSGSKARRDLTRSTTARARPII